jgi:glycosyltransferase involved in cell wall biosynthesis
MHIVQMIDILSQGGAQKLLITFAEEARIHDIKLSVISLSHHDNSPNHDILVNLGVAVYYFPMHRLADVKVLSQLIRWMWRQKPDLIHTHLTYSNIIGVLMGWLVGIPVVTTLHTIGTEPRFFGPKTDKAETISLRYGADKIIACGPAVSRAFGPKLGNKNIYVIPNATRLSGVALSQDERLGVRAQFMDDPNHQLIISIGRLVSPKSFHDLLNSFAIIHAAYPEAFLAIAGDGELYSELADQIKNLGLTDHARLLGPRSDVPQLLASSDIFVLSSQWEGLPVVILEAMAAGMPIVATDVGDVAWAIGAAGVIVPPSDPEMFAKAVVDLLKAPYQQQTLGRAGRLRVEDEFSATIWFEKILDIYNELLIQT